LFDCIKWQRYPLDDRYYRTAATDRPLEVSNIQNPENENILAQLWRSRGNATALPSENQRWAPNIAPIPHIPFIDRKKLSEGGAIAAVFRQNDPWIQQVKLQRPHDPIFISQNGYYFALPWFSQRGQLLGIWLVDMANWSALPDERDAWLVLAARVLAALGLKMDRFL
jgi:hypothetical protein